MVSFRLLLGEVGGTAMTFILALFALPAHAAPMMVDQPLPAVVTAAIATENGMSLADVHPLPHGTLSWTGGVVGAVVFDDAIPNCAIYTYQRGLLNSAFENAPCKFRGMPKMMRDRKGELPDIVYELEVFLPNRGAMVNQMVAFYYDAEKDAFCESQSLAYCYQSGNRNLNPDLQDGQCVVGARSSGT